jgi:hypothetical protein
MSLRSEPSEERRWTFLAGKGPCDIAEFFEFGLRCLLDGLEALVDRRHRSRADAGD